MKKAGQKNPPKKVIETKEEVIVLPPESQKQKWIKILIAFTVPVLLYLPSVKFELTNFDDDAILLGNMTFFSDFSNVTKAFTVDAFITKMSPFYRPLQTLSYLIDIKISGNHNYFMLHLTNVLLLGIISMLLFLLVKEFTINRSIALWLTLIYCTHPLFVSSVAWIPARGDLLLMVFSLLSMLLLIMYRQKENVIYLILHVIAFLGALFSKETAAFLPILFVLYFLLFAKAKIYDRKLILMYGLYAIAGAFWFWVRSHAIGGNLENRSDVAGMQAVLSNIRTIPESVSMLFIPYQVAAIPAFTYFKTVTGFLIIAASLVVLFLMRKKSKKEMLFGISWFVLLILPTLLFRHVLIDYLSHRFFLPLIGMVIFVLPLLNFQWVFKNEKIVTTALTIVFLISGAFTLAKSQDYANPISFYDAAVKQNDHSAIAYNNRGGLRVKNNDNAGALEDFDRASELFPRYEQAIYNRGYMKSQAGDKNGAIEDFNKAISIKHDYPEPYYHEGLANIELKNYKAAIENLTQFLVFNPNSAEAHNFRGMAYGSSGDFKSSVADFDSAIVIYPNYLEAYGNRSIAKYSMKDLTGALADCNKVLAMDAKNQNALSLKALIEKETAK